MVRFAPSRVTPQLSSEADMTRQLGFTQLEVQIVITLVGISAAIALPSYRGYVRRSALTDAIDGLSSFRLRMEQSSNNNGNYGVGACCVGPPASTANFAFAGTLTNAGQGYIASAIGSGRMAGYSLTEDDNHA